MHNLRSTEFMSLHTDVVRDIKCDGVNALTASFDKTMILSSVQNNCRIQKYIKKILATMHAHGAYPTP